MLLCIDVGNTQIFGGVFERDNIKLTFRYDSTVDISSDQFGVFLKSLLRENQIAPEAIKQIGISSVVPRLDYSLRGACMKYFNLEPSFLTPLVQKIINVKTDVPTNSGADLIADAIAATHNYPKKNIVLVSMGTANVISAVTATKDYLGCVILPGMKLSMQSLDSKAAKLFSVEIRQPSAVVGKSTAESIQSGLYYGNLGGIKEFVQRFTQEVFANKKPIVIATGGFSHLYRDESIFDAIMPNLVLDGIRLFVQYK